MNEITMPKVGLGLITNNQNKNSKAQGLKKEGNLESFKNEAPVIYKPNEVKSDFKTYDKNGHIYNKSAIDELKTQSDAKLTELKNTVKAMLEKQGYTFNDIENILNSKNSETGVKIDDATRAKAKESISEDGFYGVKKTSERILEFAKHISGDNPEKFEQIKQGIKDGFEAAKEAFGGSLPEISQQTYDAVMKGLDQWAGKSE